MQVNVQGGQAQSRPGQSKKERLVAMAEEFISELQGKPSAKPFPAADDDLRHALLGKQGRLSELGLAEEIRVDSREDDFAFALDRKTSQSSPYETVMRSRQATVTRKFKRISDGKVLFRDKADGNLYVNAVDVKEGVRKADIEEEVSCCPNCGNPVSVGGLGDGCPYCSTRFAVSDLFPRVFNYYLIEMPNNRKSKLKGRIAMFAGIGAAIGAVIGFLALGHEETGPIPAMLSGAILGGITGYIAWAMATMGGLFAQIAKSSDMYAGGALSARKNFSKLFSGIDPSFEYEYFEGDVVSLMRKIVFARDLRKCPVFEADPSGVDFANVVDFQYRGGLACDGAYVDAGGWCVVDARLYANVARYDGQKVREQPETYSIRLVRSAMTGLYSPQFSAGAVRCPTCAGSFDTMEQRHCPYCGNAYDAKFSGWVAVGMRRVR